MLKFKIRVPATIANLGPGFDSFGMAVRLYNTFMFEEADADSVILADAPSGSGQAIETKPANSLVFNALDTLLKETGKRRPKLQLTIETEIPTARGLGSSSTAIIAGLLAGNHLLKSKLDNTALLNHAIALEGHPDNVAPALLGGVILCDESATYPLPFPKHWRVGVVIPDAPVLTREARDVLPKTVALEDAVFNLRKASLLVYALLKEDGDAFAQSLQDQLHQPYRGKLIKEWDNIQTLAKQYGAYGSIISGSGSAMAVFYPNTAQAELTKALTKLTPLAIDTLGAQIIAS